MSGKNDAAQQPARLIASEAEIRLTTKLLRGRMGYMVATGDSEKIAKAFERAKQEMRDAAMRHLDSIGRVSLGDIVGKKEEGKKRNYNRAPSVKGK